jgi:hypothetical protein
MSVDHEKIVLSHEEKFKNIERRIVDLENASLEVIALGKLFASMTVEVRTAIKLSTDHIENGSKWRLTIICACVGLIGLFTQGVTKFGIMQNEITKQNEVISEHNRQIFDLNYIRGKEEGLADKNVGNLK